MKFRCIPKTSFIEVVSVRAVVIAAVCTGIAALAPSLQGRSIDMSFGFVPAGDKKSLTEQPNSEVADSFYIFAAPEVPAGKAFRWWQQSTKQINVIQQSRSPSFVARDLAAGGVLRSSETLSQFTVSFTSNWLYGGAADPTMKTYVGLIGTNGNGYLGEVSRGRGAGTQGDSGGQLRIYSLSAADAKSLTDASTWTLLGTATFDNSVETGAPNHKRIHFSFDGSRLQLSVQKADGTAMQRSSLSVDAGRTTSGFSTLLLGNMSNGKEEQRFYDIHLGGVTASR